MLPSRRAWERSGGTGLHFSFPSRGSFAGTSRTRNTGASSRESTWPPTKASICSSCGSETISSRSRAGRFSNVSSRLSRGSCSISNVTSSRSASPTSGWEPTSLTSRPTLRTHGHRCYHWCLPFRERLGHDWNYLLGTLGLLGQDRVIGGAFQVARVPTMGAGFLGGLWVLRVMATANEAGKHLDPVGRRPIT
jgi:hypothetical protein